MPRAAPVLWDVIEEHLDDASFLWDRRERALGSPLWRPAQLADRIEERLLANVDGMAIGVAVDRVLAPALEAEGAPAAAAALALLALPDGLARVLDALRSAEGARREALARALALSRRPGLERDLLAALKDPSPSLVAAALEALAFRRIDAGAALLPLLGSRAADLHLAALRAARATAQPVRAHVERACDSANPLAREAAIETGMLLGFHGAYLACQRLADSGAPGCGRALVLLAMGGDPADLPRLERALGTPGLRRAALVALGYAGRPSSMERILEWADARDAAPLVGEAFHSLTGVAVEKDLLAPPPPDEALPPLEAEDLDADLDPGVEGELPLPDAQALRQRWRKESSRFEPGQRYVAGKPFTLEALLAAFLEGSMRRRQLIGFELAVRTRRELWVETRDWASEQRRAERQQRLPSRSETKQPFSRLLQG